MRRLTGNRAHRRRGYALVYVMAAVPLIAVIGNVAVQITGQALRAQRMAVAEASDDQLRRVMVARLGQDAERTTTVEGAESEFGTSLILRAVDGVITYDCASNGVTRVERAGGVEISRTTWEFGYAECRLRLERVPGGGALVWIRVDHRFQIRKGLSVRRAYATAVGVGKGDGP